MKDGAEHRNQRHGQIVDEVHRRAHHGGVVLRLVIGLHGLPIDIVQLVQRVILLVVGLEGLLAGGHFLHEAVELAQFPGAQAEEFVGFLSDDPGDQNGQGNGEQEHQHQSGLDGQHFDQRDHDGDDAGEDLHHVGA